MTEAAAGPGVLDGLRVVAALAFVLALVVGLNWLLRRTTRLGRGRILTIEERLPVARGVQLVVVSAAGRRLLLGVGDKQVNLVTEINPGTGTPFPNFEDEIALASAPVADAEPRVGPPAASARSQQPDLAAWLVERWRATRRPA